MFLSLKPWVVPLPENDYRPKFLQSRVAFYLAVALLLLNMGAAALYFPFSKNVFFADVTKSELIRLLNEQRQSAGAGILAENQKLDLAAALKAHDMVANGYFAHQSPQGITPWFWFKKAGYSYRYAGENLAVGFADSSVLYDAWVNSPSHRANLLNPKYKEVGTAVVYGFGGNNTVVVVQLFGSQIIPPVKAAAKPAAPKPGPVQSKPAVNQTPIQASAPAQATANPGVLAETAEYATISAPRLGTTASMYYRFLNFMAYDYARLLKSASYALLGMLIICLLINVFVNIEIQRKGLILRSLLLIFIASMAVLINHENVGQLLPHFIII